MSVLGKLTLHQIKFWAILTLLNYRVAACFAWWQLVKQLGTI